jgi:chemotaxis signal transduction protein
MTVCLRVVAGGHELLLDTGSVCKVERAEQAMREPDAWPGRDLPTLDLAGRLGGAPLDRSDGVVIIYAAPGTGDGGVVLAVDEVKGLVTLGGNALTKLPPVSEEFAHLFDAIAVEPIDGRHPLHLRARLDPAAIGQTDG